MTRLEEYGGCLTFVTVSDTGADHLARQVPNQDAASFLRMGEDFALAVSDGVGSCSRAELGAAYAVKACITVLRQLKSKKLPFEDEAVIHALTTAWHASIAGGNADDYCATLKAVFKLGSLAKAVSVGDGFVALTSDGLQLVSSKDETLFANETNCLHARIQAGDFWIADFPIDTDKPYAVLCCTDGVANGLLPGTEVSLTEEIERELSGKELAVALGELLKDISNYCFDDKTVGVVKYECGNEKSHWCDGSG